MRRSSILIPGLILVIAAALLGLVLGGSALPIGSISKVLLGNADQSDWAYSIVMEVRLPRVLLALVIGASLAETGVVLQALFRNPLAEHSLLGISGGAALAAAIWLVMLPALFGTSLALSRLSLPLAATLGAIAAAAAVIRLARQNGETDIATLLLAGLSINALAGAGIALLQSLASDAVLRDLMFWFYGSLGRSSWGELAIGLPVLAAIALWLPREAAALDALLLGEAEAQHLGLNLEAIKRRLLLLAAVAAATTVVLAGMIGFIGLIVPHLIRRVLGPGHRLLLPASGLFGAALLCLADTAARTVFSPLEVPVGVITALLGAPLFLYLLKHRRGA